MPGAKRFDDRIGESEMQRVIARIKTFIDKHGGVVGQTDIYRHTGLNSREVGLVRETMEQSGLVKMGKLPNGALAWEKLQW
jgi:hypothetical protein